MQFLQEAGQVLPLPLLQSLDQQGTKAQEAISHLDIYGQLALVILVPSRSCFSFPMFTLLIYLEINLKYLSAFVFLG